MKKIILYIICLLCTLNGAAQKKDFGTTGLKGLSAEQRDKLSQGEVILLDDVNEESKNKWIEAAIVFNASPEATWKLVAKTDDQPKYINQCKEIKVVTKSGRKAVEVHTVGAALVTWNYGVIENYDAQNNYLYWSLDPGYEKNDLEALSGYWRFYPYANGKTLARYGSSISFKKVPEFVENMFKKGGVKDALTAVKKYVDSGGAYRK